MNFLALSTSRGTTFQAVIDAMKSGELSAKCIGLVSDDATRGCVAKAKAADIPVLIVEKRPGETREQYDARLDADIRKFIGNAADDVLLACLGWMYIMSPLFIAKWKNRVLNVHPALLPKYGGAGMYGDRVHEAVLKNRERESGITIHLIDEGVDTGKILLQKTCPVLPDDTVEALRDRAQSLEKEWYPKVLKMIETGELNI